jgi:serine/threonine-protein kinase
LIGILVGLGYDLVFAAESQILIARGAHPSTSTYLDSLLGFKYSLAVALGRLLVGLFGTLVFFLMLFVLRVIVRKEWLAAVLFALFFIVGRGFTSPHPAYDVPAMVIVYGLIVFVLLRFGLLALLVTIFVTDLVPELVFTTNLTAWYGNGTLLVVLIVVAMSLVAFRNALGSARPLSAFLDQ